MTRVTRRRLLAGLAATPVLGLPLLESCCPASRRGKTRRMPYVCESDVRECRVTYEDLEKWLESLFGNVTEKHKFAGIAHRPDKGYVEIVLRDKQFCYGQDPGE